VLGLAGVYYYFINDYSKGLEYFTKATELDEQYAPAYNMIGYAQSDLSNYEAAEEAFKTYISLIPDSPNPYDSYAELLLKVGKYDESIEQYQKAFEKDPMFATALEGVGNNYIFKGDFDTARKYYQNYFDKAPNINGKLRALFLKATSFVHEGKIEKALDTFKEYRALAEKKDVPNRIILSYTYQGFILTETGNPIEGMNYYDKAIASIEKLKLSKPVKENFITYSLMWQFYVLTAKNDLDKAESQAEKCKQKVASRHNPNEEKFLYSLYGDLEIKKGNFDKAIEHYSNSDTENPLNMYYMANAYDKKGDKKNASKLFKKISNWNENSLNLALVRNRAMDKLKK